MTRAPQVGDRIQVTGTVMKVKNDGEAEVHFDGDPIPNNFLSAAAAAAGTLLPSQLKVGDTVRTCGGSVDGNVLVIHEDSAGVAWANGFRSFMPLADLTLADSEAGK